MTTRMKLKDMKPQGGATSHGWHQIQAFLRCSMEYKLKEVCGLRKPAITTPDPLAKGSLFHEGRAWWFTNSFPTGQAAWAKLQTHVEACADAMALPPRQEAITDSLRILDQYCSHWAIRAKPKVKAVEYAIGPAPLKPDSPWWAHRTAKLDDVSEYPEAMGKLCIGEAKTTSVGVDDCENEYNLHGQTMLQWMLWRAASNGEKKYGPVSFIMLDVVKKGYGKEKCSFARVPVQITHTSLAWYVKSMEYYLNAAARVTPTSPVPRNITACTRLIGRMRVPCEFRELCKYGGPVSNSYVNKEGISAAKVYAGVEPKPWD